MTKILARSPASRRPLAVPALLATVAIPIAGLIAPAGAAPAGAAPAGAAPAGSARDDPDPSEVVAAKNRRPDVIVVMTDDQRIGSQKGMPYLWDELRPKMTHYPNALVPNNNCCPSRSSFLSGQYSHTTGVWDNTSSGFPGGWKQFARSGFERRTIATALQQRGYRNVFLGKYLNQYAQFNNARTHRPPGWSDFRTYVRSNGGYWAPPHPIAGVPAGYTTDTLGDAAVQAIAATPKTTPLFLMVTPYAPHSPARSGPYEGTANRIGALDRMREGGEWTNPAVGEANRRDKPAFNRVLPKLDRDDEPGSPFPRVRRFTRNQADTLMGVDANLRKIVEQQRAVRDWDNTLVVFLSDNGIAWGDHALFDKTTPYRLTNGIPMLIKYPSWVDGTADTDRRLINQLDVTATIADLTSAGLRTAGFSARRPPARTGLLLESPTSKNSYGYWHPSYCAWRTEDALYVRYRQGTEELYDYRRDPYELVNRATDPAYAALKSAMLGAAMVACNPAPPLYEAPVPRIRLALQPGSTAARAVVTPAPPGATVGIDRQTPTGWTGAGACRLPQRGSAAVTFQVPQAGAYRARLLAIGALPASGWSAPVRLNAASATFTCV